MMRTLKYCIPLFICAVFVLLCMQGLIWVFFPFLILLNQGNALFGDFNERELQEELYFFHGSATMVMCKVISGIALALANVWFFYFVATSSISISDLVLFSLAVSIINCTFLLALAHDLIHDNRPLVKRLGQGLLFFVGMPFFCHDHVHGHHEGVGLKSDASTAEFGISFYRYLYRVIPYRIKESFLLNPSYPSDIRHRIRNENISLTLLNLAFLVTALLLLPQAGHLLFWFALQATLTYLMFELSNYIQHYGLERMNPNQIGVNIAWDYYNKYTNYIAYLVPLHSYHHMDFLNKEKQAITIDNRTRMPYCYYRMIMLALVPSLWFQLMNPKCEQLPSATGRAKVKSRKRKWALGAILVMASFTVLGQGNVGLKYFGFTVHPKGDEQAHLMPKRLDAEGVFIPNVGGIISYQHQVFQDLLSVKFAQGLYTDSGNLLAGHTHIGFRLVFYENNRHSFLFGFGPTWIYRENWKVKEGYEPSGIFEDRGKYQYKFIWYGGELEYNYWLKDNLDLSVNFLPGYPLVMSFGVGVRYWIGD